MNQDLAGVSDQDIHQAKQVAGYSAAAVNQSQDDKRSKVSYKPYTLKEYKEKQSMKGGFKMSTSLGSNVGSDEWKKRNSMAQKQKEYAAQIKKVN